MHTSARRGDTALDEPGKSRSTSSLEASASRSVSLLVLGSTSGDSSCLRRVRNDVVDPSGHGLPNGCGIGRELHALSGAEVRLALVHVLRVHCVRVPVVVLVAVHVAVSVRVLVVCHLSQRRGGRVRRTHHAACDWARPMHRCSEWPTRSPGTAHEVAPCAHAGTTGGAGVVSQRRHAQTAVAAETDVRKYLIDCTAEVLEALLDLVEEQG